MPGSSSATMGEGSPGCAVQRRGVESLIGERREESAWTDGRGRRKAEESGGVWKGGRKEEKGGGSAR